MNTWKIIRRILWMLYACPITLLLFVSYPIEIWQYGLSIFPFAMADFLISFPSLAAMFLHAWDTKLFAPTFWKIYALVLVIWDLAGNLIIHPAITGEKVDWTVLIGFVVLLPLYISVFRYGFRNWANMKNSLSPDDAAGQG